MSLSITNTTVDLSIKILFLCSDISTGGSSLNGNGGNRTNGYVSLYIRRIQ